MLVCSGAADKLSVLEHWTGVAAIDVLAMDLGDE